jgi:hypothetical protein
MDGKVVAWAATVQEFRLLAEKVECARIKPGYSREMENWDANDRED